MQKKLQQIVIQLSVFSKKHLVPCEIPTSLVIQLVLTELDYCDSIVFGSTKWVTHKLQTVMNIAARVVFNARLSDHVIDPAR